MILGSLEENEITLTLDKIVEGEGDMVGEGGVVGGVRVQW